MRLTFCIGIFFMLSCGEAEMHVDWLAPPKIAPNFELETLLGESIRLSDMRGQMVVIDFWATWCAPCVRQIPVLNRFHSIYGDEVSVLGVSVDAGGREEVAKFAREHDIRYEVLLGTESLAQRFGALGYPALFVVRDDGSIESVHHGVISAEDLEVAIDSLR